jgi:bacterial/archaeal transporter family protein
LKRAGKWLPQAQLAFLSWGIFGFLSKIGSGHLSAEEMQVLFLCGTIPLILSALFKSRKKIETDRVGVIWALLTGIVASLGNVAYFAALHHGKASIIAPVTALYPLVSVALAALVLKERVNRFQFAGILMAVLAIFLLSL